MFNLIQQIYDVFLSLPNFLKNKLKNNFLISSQITCTKIRIIFEKTRKFKINFNNLKYF